MAEFDVLFSFVEQDETPPTYNEGVQPAWPIFLHCVHEALFYLGGWEERLRLDFSSMTNVQARATFSDLMGEVYVTETEHPLWPSRPTHYVLVFPDLPIATEITASFSA